MTNAICLFSGPGGSTQGLKNAAIENVVGVEWDESAVNTARAAGHTVIHQDVRLLDPLLVVHEWCELFVPILLQASPPCQGLSMAGKGKGREDLDALFNAVNALSLVSGFVSSWDEAKASIPTLMDALTEDASDERSPLTFEVMRWIFEITPDFIMLEQVPAALPIWEAIADVLRSWGYSVWTGNVYAEQYGVPQTRKRAILMASCLQEVNAPVPTHSKYHNRTPTKLDEGVAKWVSMAEALGWGMTRRPYLTVAPGVGQGGPDSLSLGGSGARKAVYAEHDAGHWIAKPELPEAIVGAGLTGQGTPRDVDDPAPTMTAAGNAYWLMDKESYGTKKVTHMGDVRSSKGCVRPLDAPSPTITASMDNGNFQYVDREALIEEVTPRVNNQSGTEFDLAWPADRPAPVVAGRDIITMPGANANRFNGATKSRNDGIRVSVEEAGVLQSFPADYPWQGTKSKKHEQVGNAVPPLLQEVLTRQLVYGTGE